MITARDYVFERECQYANLIELLQYRAKTQPTEVAYKFVTKGTIELAQITYQELDRQARAIAAALQQRCVVGDRALLLYPSGLEFISAFFGCLYAGVVAVPAYPPRRNQKMSRLQAVMAEAQAKIALTTESLMSNIQSRFAEIEFGESNWLATDNVAKELATSWQEYSAAGDSLAFLQYTSGSTGRPKGVMISHGNILANQRAIALAFGHTADTVVVGWLPLFHDMGLIGNVLQPLYLGKPCILMSPVDFLQRPFRWLQAISHFQATTSGGPNFAYDLCLRKIKPEQRASLDLSKWEVAFTGAEPVRADTLKQFASVFQECGFRKEALYPCYGMAETTLFVTGGTKTDSPAIKSVAKTALEQNRVEIGVESIDTCELVSCGQTRQDMCVKIVDPQTSIECPPDRIGEIWISGSSVAQGYWNRSLESEKTFQATIADTQQGAFLRTGDLGFMRDGELFITGRLKDLIIIRGQNYYPQDIERTIETSHPALKPGSSAAFAVEIKKMERLIVVQEIERSYLRKLDVEVIIGNLREAVTAEHGLQVYATVLVKPGTIPKTSSGKIKRHACSNQFLNGTLDVVADWSENPQCKAEFLRLQAEIESVLQKANQRANSTLS